MQQFAQKTEKKSNVKRKNHQKQFVRVAQNRTKQFMKNK